MRRRLLLAPIAAFTFACGGEEDFDHETDPSLEVSQAIEASLDCRTRQDTGYSRGSAFAITVVTVDGKPVEQSTANAFEVMRQQAAREGVALRVVSGFRTNAEQQRLYSCYVRCNCNNCNLAARPGYSNHQSGHALDIYTGSGVVSWLRRRGGAFGFRETVSGEPWHWEWWGGGPGGGPCGAQPAEPPPPPPNSYQVIPGKFSGGAFTDVLTISKNGGGGWADWAAIERSNGGGFVSNVWGAATPVHMRNGGRYSDYNVIGADFDGDGDTDLATISKNGGGGWRDWIAMELSSGGGFFSTVWPANTPIHMRNGDSNADYRVLSGDFDGNGRIDLATISRNGGGGWRDWIALELSTGNGFISTVWPANTPIHMRNGDSNADYVVLTGDFDGNGRTDLATITRNGGGGWRDWIAIELSTGAGFVSTVWAASTPQHMRNGDSNADYRVLSGDFDGNGRTDIATITRNGGGGWSDWVALELSAGNGFVSTVWRASTPQHMRNGDRNADYRVLAADFDGDGRTDLATISPNGGGGWRDWIAIERSNGGGFDSTVWGAATPIHMRNGGSSADYRVFAGDFDGDGRADITTLSPSGGGGWRDWLSVERSTGGGFQSMVWGANTPIHIRNGG